MDFIKALPSFQSYLVIFVVVDQFKKYAHFLPFSFPFATITIAKLLFINQIFKLHGMPATIVTD